MIFTSNFKITGHLPQAVAICRGLPKGWAGRQYLPLAPTWAMIKGNLDPSAFTRVYRETILNKLDPLQVLKDLGGDNFIMLCWEPPGKFCHRWLVAGWIEEATGVKVPELSTMFNISRILDPES
jgi:hypothetical protein